MRLDTQFKVRFYGYCKGDWRDVKKVRRQEGGEEVVAVAYDISFLDFNTFNCNTLRLWKSFPGHDFNFERFNKDEYKSSLAEFLLDLYLKNSFILPTKTFNYHIYNLKIDYHF